MLRYPGVLGATAGKAHHATSRNPAYSQCHGTNRVRREDRVIHRFGPRGRTWRRPGRAAYGPLGSFITVDRARIFKLVSTHISSQSVRLNMRRSASTTGGVGQAQKWVKASGQKVIALFEGRDAAGKGGTIKRFTEHLNPRGARIVALDKPNETSAVNGIFSATLSSFRARRDDLLRSVLVQPCRCRAGFRLLQIC